MTIVGTIAMTFCQLLSVAPVVSGLFMFGDLISRQDDKKK